MWMRGERTTVGPLEMEHIRCSIEEGEGILGFFVLRIKKCRE